jgi:hypothetical protein
MKPLRSTHGGQLTRKRALTTLQRVLYHAMSRADERIAARMIDASASRAL